MRNLFTWLFIAKYLFTGSVKILKKIYFNEKSWNLLLFIFWKIQINSNENSKRNLIISTQSAVCSTSFVSLHWSWNTHMCQVVCNPGMNFMKFHAYLLKGWFSSLITLCELVSNRNSSSLYEMILTRKAWQQGIMAGSFAWKTLIAFSFVHHSPFDKPKNP